MFSVTVGLAQVMSACGFMLTVGAVLFSSTITDAVAVQPFVPVTVTVYVPPAVTLFVLPVPPPLQA